MKTYYQVGIIEQKIFDGSVEHAATRDQRTRVLTFETLEDAIPEFEAQVKRVKATAEYSKRHKATEEIHSIVDILKNGAAVVDPYWFEITYSNNEIKTFEDNE